jgi:hypothetical protein
MAPGFQPQADVIKFCGGCPGINLLYPLIRRVGLGYENTHINVKVHGCFSGDIVNKIYYLFFLANNAGIGRGREGQTDHEIKFRPALAVPFRLTENFHN